MFENFNLNINGRQNRFIASIVAGVLAAIILGTLYGVIMHSSNLSSEFALLYIGVGYLIGNVVKVVGRGVQRQYEFSWVAVGCTVLAILIGDMVAALGVDIFFHLNLLGDVYPIVFNGFYNFFENPAVVLGLVIRASSAYMAFFNSRITVNMR
ncbi:MAG: hypothetical protein LBR25_02540 [Erysipelotrichaceae bacterium]|jgi:hypothetical protein|nr:hypothetical protein [Erysipelotrichaceae bacterium]